MDFHEISDIEFFLLVKQQPYLFPHLQIENVGMNDDQKIFLKILSFQDRVKLIRELSMK